MVDVPCTLSSEAAEWIPDASENRWTTIWSNVLRVQIYRPDARRNLDTALVWYVVASLAKEAKGVAHRKSGNTEPSSLHSTMRENPECRKKLTHRDTI